MKTQQESGTAFLEAILLIILIVILIFLTACTPSSDEPKMLFKPSTPFAIDNSSFNAEITPYAIDCVHKVVCYRYYGNRLTCTYTEVRIKECEQQ